MRMLPPLVDWMVGAESKLMPQVPAPVMVMFPGDVPPLVRKLSVMPALGFHNAVRLPLVTAALTVMLPPPVAANVCVPDAALKPSPSESIPPVPVMLRLPLPVAVTVVLVEDVNCKPIAVSPVAPVVRPLPAIVIFPAPAVLTIVAVPPNCTPPMSAVPAPSVTLPVVIMAAPSVPMLVTLAVATEGPAGLLPVMLMAPVAL